MSRQSPLPAVLLRYRDDILSHLQGISRGDSLLYRMMRFQLGFEDESGQALPGGLGKALRPAVCLFTCEVLGADWRKALPAATALELVHSFSLVHDDIQDRDEERRHCPTLWMLWGVGQAINAGDAFHTLAMRAVSELRGAGVPAERVTRAHGLLSQATFEMIEGQCLDLQYEERFDLTSRDYLLMISRKTGALIDCAFGLGALVGGADEETLGVFRRAGRHLGLAFQIRDDLLGIWGEPSEMGKPASDLWRKKRTLPVIYAMEFPDSRARVQEFLRCEPLTDEEVYDLRSVLEKTGADRYAAELGEKEGRSALDSLREIELPGWALEAYEELVNFSVYREK